MSISATDSNSAVSEVLRALPAVDSDHRYATILELVERAFEALCAGGVIPIIPTLRRRPLATTITTALGCVPHSLLHATGLFEMAVDFVLSKATPWCSRCGCDAIRPQDISQYEIPSGGVVAISISGDARGYSLREWCELLGVERAVVRNALVRSVDIGDEDGEPVLVVGAARELEAVLPEVTRWFAHGGGALRILHFASRDAVGVEIGRIHSSWICASCQNTFEAISRAKISEIQPCLQCKGLGWIAVTGDFLGERHRACDDCDGNGALSEFFAYRCFGRPLDTVMRMSVSELAAHAQSDSTPLAAELGVFLARLTAVGFGNYRIGSAIDLFSPGENALLAVSMSELSMLADARYLLDAAYSSYSTDSDEGVGIQERLMLAAPVPTSPREVRQHPLDSNEIVRLRDIRQGPLDVADVSFPMGGITALQGCAGGGKSLLLEIVAARFAKRRKLAHLASFGGLQRCALISGFADPSGTVLELLGLTGDVAAEIVRTRKAKEFGVLESDLELPRSKYRCCSCEGTGVSAEGDRCQMCQGALYDWRVSSLPLFDSSVRELLRTPIRELVGLLWQSREVEAVLRLAAEHVQGAITLASAVEDLNPCTRRFLKIVGHLGRFLGDVNPRSRAHSLAKQLILIDGPCAMPADHQHVVLSLLLSLRQRGATVVYASMPKSLEIEAQSVLRLEFKKDTTEWSAREKYLDSRYARMSDVIVSR
jgi:hypothetical protein